MPRFVCRVGLMLFVMSLLVTGLPAAGLAQEATPAAECIATTPEENAELAVFYRNEVVWGEQGVVRELLAPDVVYHWSFDINSVGMEAFNEAYSTLLSAFPDIEYDVDLVVAEGDHVAITWTASGTQRGEWQGIAPTGRDVSFTGANFFRFECGVIAEAWGEADHLGILAQLGAPDVPAVLGTPAAEAVLAGPMATPCPDDTGEGNIELARRWTEEVWTGQDPAVIGEILDANAVHHGAAFPDVRGAEAIAEAVGRQLEAFPAMNLAVDAAVAENDLVAVRWSGTMTNDGHWLSVEATGKTVDATGINFYRVTCGKIVESWSEMNALQILQQLSGHAAAATPAA